MTARLLWVMAFAVVFGVACGSGGGDGTSGIPVSQVELSAPIWAGAVAVSPDGVLVAAVNPDSDSVSLVETGSNTVIAEVGVGDDPRTLAFTPDSSHVLVANHGDGSVSAIDVGTRSESVRWEVGPRPYGIVTDGAYAYITESALGHVVMISLASGEVAQRVTVGDSPFGIALVPGRALFVTHLFTGRITSLSPDSLEVIGQASTGRDTNLSQFIAIGPDGVTAYLPQTRSNSTNKALIFDSTVFPVVNVLNLESLTISPRSRITIDTADQPVNMPFAVALSPDGMTIYIANAGSNDLSIVDLETMRATAHLSLGANPRGITISPDGTTVYVNNVLDGTLTVIDAATNAIREVVDLTEIPLEPEILLGKQIFNRASEPDLATDNWISCAVCHFDGGSDRQTWLGFPDGPRNTPSLLGVGDTLPIHWSGDLDELQDVELTVRNIQAGEGLAPGPELDSLGPPHAGLSEELDALAAFMRSLNVGPSLLDIDSGSAAVGESVFGEQGCATCHEPPLFIDRQIHDVGTGDAATERNSHDRGTQFDTPSLLGIWESSPYFHDGSAATLRDVFMIGTVHNIVDDLSEEELRDMVNYLLALPTD